ncbi:MAG: AAA family ATPase, partial [Candidatus Micrarchaeaceae archaeon]
MLYLKSLYLRNFKSFKKGELRFSKGFTCIVGPNGSGKSNICDAILFGLGENSLKRLRTVRFGHLINASSKRDKFGVKMEFDGDEKITVLRVANKNGKSVYKVNGRRMSRREVIELLLKYGIKADETNTITQGEINRLIDLTPKERRELIDIASGIKEFDEKKEEALKELSQVDIKINESKLVLREREGFLEELRKEKEAAEKYIDLTNRLKSLKFSILVLKKRESEEALNSIVRELEEVEKNLSELEKKKKEIEERISNRSKEISELTETLNKSNVVQIETKKKYDSINSSIIKLEYQRDLMLKEIEESKRSIEEIEKKIKEREESIKKDERELEEISAKKPEENSNYGNSIIEENEVIQKLEKEIEELEKEREKKLDELSSAKARSEAIAFQLGSLEQELEKSRASMAVLRAEYYEETEVAQDSRKIEEMIKESKDNLSKLYEIEISLKEELAYTRPEKEIDLSQFKGFYGKVEDLYQCKDDFYVAVSSALGARSSYAVVESIDDAHEIISYLKENGVGRMTFIPL